MAVIFLKAGIDGFDLKNVNDILKLGLIGLGFFLCFWSFRLVYRKLEGKNRVKSGTGLIIGFMIFSVIVMVGALLWKILDNEEVLKALFVGKEVTVNSSRSTNPKRIDSTREFKDDNYQYAFEKPGEAWQRPVEYNGLRAVIGSNVLSSDTAVYFAWIENRLRSSPLKEMIEQERLFVIERKDSRIKVELTPETTNPSIEFNIGIVRSNLIATHRFDTSNAFDRKELKDSLDNIKSRSFLVPSHISFANRFAISVFDKTLLPSYLSKMSIADLLRYELPLLSTIGQLSADKDGILMEGVSAHYENVLIDGKGGNFQADKLILLRANKRFFFLVEVNYSPQASGSPQVYEDLVKLIKSFKVYDD